MEGASGSETGFWTRTEPASGSEGVFYFFFKDFCKKKLIKTYQFVTLSIIAIPFFLGFALWGGIGVKGRVFRVKRKSKGGSGFRLSLLFLESFKGILQFPHKLGVVLVASIFDSFNVLIKEPIDSKKFVEFLRVVAIQRLTRF